MQSRPATLQGDPKSERRPSDRSGGRESARDDAMDRQEQARGQDKKLEQISTGLKSAGALTRLRSQRPHSDTSMQLGTVPGHRMSRFQDTAGLQAQACLDRAQARSRSRFRVNQS